MNCYKTTAIGLGSHSLETSFLAPPAEASTIDIARTTSHWERKGSASRRKNESHAYSLKYVMKRGSMIQEQRQKYGTESMMAGDYLDVHEDGLSSSLLEMSEIKAIHFEREVNDIIQKVI
jgi:hypothetical protein